MIHTSIQKNHNDGKIDANSVLTGVIPAFYRPTPLVRDIEELSDPEQKITRELLLNAAHKYFFSYVHEGAHEQPVPWSEISDLTEKYGRHLSMNEPGDDIEVMNNLRQWSQALRLPADICRAAHLMRAVIKRKIDPEPFDSRYHSLDVGAGAGLLLLSEHIQARRNGFESVEAWGIEQDQVAGKRTRDFIRTLGVGHVTVADPGKMESYGMLGNGNLVFVSTEYGVGLRRLLRARRFFKSFETLFASAGPLLNKAQFFPEGMIVYSKEMNVSLILSKDNGFQAPPEYMGTDFNLQGLFIDGRVLPLHRLGKDFAGVLVG